MSQGSGVRGWAETESTGVGVHGELIELEDDDHPQYLLLDGRAGGQVVFGGIATGETLTLAGNSVDSNSFVDVNGRLRVTNPSAGDALLITATIAGSLGNLLELNASGSAATNSPILSLAVAPATVGSGLRYTVMRVQGTTVRAGTGTPFVLFDVAAAFDLQGVAGSGQVFFYAPTISDDGSIRTVGMSARVIIANPVYAALTAGSTGNASSLTLLDAAPNVDASWNAMSFVRFITFVNPTGTHAAGVTDYTGMFIPDSMTKPTNVYSILNLEDRAEMYHRGRVALGGGAAFAAATSLLHLRDNALDHTSITLDEVAADGPLPTLDNQARVYVKNNKLVIQWNLGGANLWSSMVLNPAGPYPVAGAWVTDVVAP